MILIFSMEYRTKLIAEVVRNVKRDKKKKRARRSSPSTESSAGTPVTSNDGQQAVSSSEPPPPPPQAVEPLQIPMPPAMIWQSYGPMGHVALPPGQLQQPMVIQVPTAVSMQTLPTLPLPSVPGTYIW